jgi:hypothetical protein
MLVVDVLDVDRDFMITEEVIEDSLELPQGISQPRFALLGKAEHAEDVRLRCLDCGHAVSPNTHS